MTLPQFIVHLKQQPWELDYVSNILSQHTRLLHISTARSFIDVFTWSKSLNKPADFWRDLHYTRRYSTVGIITIEDVIRQIAYEYKDSHPELLI